MLYYNNLYSFANVIKVNRGSDITTENIYRMKGGRRKIKIKGLDEIESES